MAVLAVCVVVLCACDDGILTRDKLVENGYGVVVTYDFNGGKNDDGASTVTIYIRSGSRIPKPGGEGASFGEPTKENCSFRGYYSGKKNDDGVVEYSDTPWNFAKDTVTEDTTLYALWWDDFIIAVHCDDGATDRIQEITIAREQNGAAMRVEAAYVTASKLNMNKRTIISYYTDENRTEEIVFPAMLPFEDTDEGRRIDIYVESLDGTWTVIRTADQFVNTLGLSSATTTNFYIKNDLDLAGKTVKFPDYYSGTFDGNGKTISNVSLTQTVVTNAVNTAYFGLFRELRGGASVKNVTFANVSLVVTPTGGRNISECFIGLFAGYVYNNVKLSNVTVSGSLTYANRVGATTIVNPFIGEKANSVDVSSCHYDDITVHEPTA